MLKPLLVILTLVSLLALGLNLGFFDDEENISTKITEHRTLVTHTQNIPPLKVNREENQTKIVNATQNNDTNLSIKLTRLLQKASKHFQKNEDAEALRIYNEIIKQSKNSNNPKILKYFADALFAKAIVHTIYPNNDIDSAIEAYETILDKFSSRNETELLHLYMTAKLEQAKLMSKEDLITAYNDLISKFEKDKEHRFDREVEEFLFAKSFELMGDNDEEAMEVLDNIIAKYQKDGNKKLPETVQYSILNNIELSIITNNDDEKYVELANKYLSKEKGTQALLDMLNIIKNAQDLEQSEAIKEWSKQHSDYYFPNWDFSELEKWATKMENPEGQQRVREYLALFKKQKYNRPYQSTANDSSPSNEIDDLDSEETTNTEDYENSVDTLYPTYEPDPYINDIYQQSYPTSDPYENSYPIQNY